MAKFCVKCGKELKPGSTSCIYCGVHIKDQTYGENNVVFSKLKYIFFGYIFSAALFTFIFFPLFYEYTIFEAIMYSFFASLIMSIYVAVIILSALLIPKVGAMGGIIIGFFWFLSVVMFLVFFYFVFPAKEPLTRIAYAVGAAIGIGLGIAIICFVIAWGIESY